MNFGRLLRYGVLVLLLCAFASVMTFASINAGDEELSPEASAWLLAPVKETASTRSGAVLAASLLWKMKEQKKDGKIDRALTAPPQPAGAQVLLQLKEAQKTPPTERWAALDAIARGFNKNDLSTPMTCQKSQLFCESDERDRVRREIERVQGDLALYRALFKEDGIGIDLSPTLAPSGISPHQLTILARYDLRDLSFTADREPSKTIAGIRERARFWKAVMHERTPLPLKMAAVENFEELSVFLRDWVLAGVSERKTFPGKMELLNHLTELKADLDREDFKSVMESSLIRETQIAAGTIALMKDEPVETTRRIRETRAFVDAGTDGAFDEQNQSLFSRIASDVAAHLRLTGFQPNRTVNFVQRLQEASLSPACQLDAEAGDCMGALNEITKRAWPEKLQNLVGRKLFKDLAMRSRISVHRAHALLVGHNETLDGIERVLSHPGPDAIESLKEAGGRNTAASEFDE